MDEEGLNKSIEFKQNIREKRETMDMLSGLFHLFRRVGIPDFPGEVSISSTSK